MGNMTSSGAPSNWDGFGKWQLGNDDGDMIMLHIWDNGDLSWAHMIVTKEGDLTLKCHIGRVPCTWTQDGKKYAIEGSGLMCGAGKVDISVQITATQNIEVALYDMPSSPYGERGGDEPHENYIMERTSKKFDISLFEGMPRLM